MGGFLRQNWPWIVVPIVLVVAVIVAILIMGTEPETSAFQYTEY